MIEKLKYITSVAALFLAMQNISAQTPESKFQNLNELIEFLSEEKEEGDENATWLEELQQLYENPVNINNATKEELLKIPFLNEITANNILEYRKKSGPFFSIFELSAVEGIGRDNAEKISFFIVTETVSTNAQTKNEYRRKPQQQLLVKGWINNPLPAGYRPKNDKPKAFEGGPEKIYARYIFEQTENFQFGITADKDPGESFFNKSNKYGFDFYSAHLRLKVNQWIPQVVFGDFTVRSGQGLVLWQGFTTGKSADVLQVSKNMSQIRPYTSSDENNFFRGITATFQHKNSSLNLFLSSKNSDGNLAMANDSTQIFTSLQTSGYHRTISEIDDKNSVRHSVGGAIFNINFHQFKVGATVLYEQFQFPYVKGDQLYEKFQFTGRENYNLGADYRWVNGKFQLYGEGAVSKSGGIAILQGIDARLHDQLNLTLLFRHFNKNYHANWANVFAENDNAINETGMYAGVKILPLSKITLSAYADWYRSPWLNYRTAAPSMGNDFMVQADLRWSRKVTGYVRLKTREKTIKTNFENRYVNETELRNNLRFHLKYELSDYFFMRWRIETVWLKTPVSEKGYLIFQDFGWTPPGVTISATARLSYFNTESFSSAVYAWENDLLYNFSTLAFYGEGFRSYLNVRWQLSEKIDAWGKIANTRYFDRNTISSGNSEINANYKTEFKIQLRYRF